MQKHNQNIKGISGVMVGLAWAVGLIFMTYLFQQFLDDQYNPNQVFDENIQPGDVREVILERNAQGHYVASGLINQRKVTFLLDTGATDVAIPQGLADRLGLQRLAGGFSQTANGTVAVWKTQLDSVQLGVIKLNNVRATIVPSMGNDSPVLLGMSFLKKLELIQREGRLTLRQGVVKG